MKIGVICFWDRQATPYLEKYERNLNKYQIQYDIILWNRTGTPTNNDKKDIEICLRTKKGKINKIISFWQWRNSALKILKSKEYDYLIVLTTYPAVLLYSYLQKCYREKFIFDIRDYSLESVTYFKKIVMKLINISKFTTISSKGFMQWLDNSNKIIINHNITHIDLDYKRTTIFPNKNNINITFVGNIRLDGQTTELLLTMKNSKRYTFGFIGRLLKECNLLEICKNNNIDNYFVEGAFKNSEKPAIYQKVDIINAVYANDANNLKLADSTPLPNRIYDAAIFKCPVVASKETYLAELIKEYKLGFEINGFNKDVENIFDEYINNFDEDEFRNGCDRFLKDILKEENSFRQLVRDTLLNWKGEIA